MVINQESLLLWCCFFYCSYVVDLTYYLLTKLMPNHGQGDPAVERLVEARTVSQFYYKLLLFIFLSSCFFKHHNTPVLLVIPILFLSFFFFFVCVCWSPTPHLQVLLGQNLVVASLSPIKFRVCLGRCEHSQVHQYSIVLISRNSLEKSSLSTYSFFSVSWDESLVSRDAILVSQDENCVLRDGGNLLLSSTVYHLRSVTCVSDLHENWACSPDVGHPSAANWISWFNWNQEFSHPI